MRDIFHKSFDGRRTLVTLGIVVVGLHLAKTCIFVAVGQPPIEGDAGHYWADGERMASGDWLMARGDVETIRTPGYPFLLALFQLGFGHHALIAATVCQQLMVFATAMVLAWVCARISGTWLGGLCGLTLGLFCVSQNAVAEYLLSDTLFGLLLTLAVAMLVAWFERPTAMVAVAIGLLLGLATLVRPIAQFAWAPILLAMAFRWRNPPLSPGEGQVVRDLKMRRWLAHAACLLGVFATVLAPWYARNYHCCGRAFLSKTAGITMWCSLFKQSGDARLNPAMPFADAPKTKAMLARLDGVDLRSHWAVLRALQKQNLTCMEGNDLMQEVCLESIKAHPWKFVDSRLRRFAWFWITPNGTRRPRSPEFHVNEDRPEETPALDKSLEAGEYCNQAYWRWDGYYRDGKLNWFWYPNPWLYVFAALVSACGVTAMLRNRRQRPFALACGLLLGYFGVMTAIGAPPEYRYRMPLEPIMAVCAVSQAMSLAERFFVKSRGLAAETQDHCK